VPSEDAFGAFLSHSHHDAGFVEALTKHLADDVGLRVWLDKWVLALCGTVLSE
jgi:hypothetical protein